MKKILIILFLALSVVCSAQRYRQDSINFVNGDWKVDTLSAKYKTYLKTVRFSKREIFNSNQCIAYLEIPKSSPYSFAFTYEPRRTKISTHATKNNAVAAINGSYFDMEKHFPICYLRINGKNYGENTPSYETSINRKYFQYGVLLIDSTGHLTITKALPRRKWEDTVKCDNIMTSGPLLIYKGEVQKQLNDREFITSRHNRTAVGVRKNGTVILFTVDGRLNESAGCSIYELTAIMQWLGCVDAVNLDGGGSTGLWLDNGKDFKGIVNYPSDNGRFDHNGERAVSNCVIVKKRARNPNSQGERRVRRSSETPGQSTRKVENKKKSKKKKIKKETTQPNTTAPQTEPSKTLVVDSIPVTNTIEIDSTSTTEPIVKPKNTTKKTASKSSTKSTSKSSSKKTTKLKKGLFR
ncbi:MAG: phosphodiester glycosidase family protein [Bacteroidales bacterium]|nr:phosphodiester glycosidase family protein [Bacteroidales bacterium]